MKKDLIYLNFNEIGVLKPTALLWLIMLFETWHWWSSIFVAFSKQLWIFSEGYSYVSFLVESPVVLLLVALAWRRPGAWPVIAKIWASGRVLLMLSAILNAFGLVYVLSKEAFWLVHQYGPPLVMLFGHISALIYVLQSRLLSDIFADFPRAADKP